MSDKLINFEIDEIVEIKVEDRNDRYVYDISVEDTERFFARDPESNGYVLVHNTSMYPSLCQMFNIDFYAYRARIYPITTYLILQTLKKLYNAIKQNDKQKIKKILNTLKKSQEIWIDNFIEWYKPQKNLKPERRIWNS